MAVEALLWLKTFQNQRHVAHQASILFSVGLFVAGFITFASSGMEDWHDQAGWERNRRRTVLAWSSSALGMISTALNGVLYAHLIKSDRQDYSATEEQMTVRRLNVTAIGCIFLGALAVGQLVLFGKASSQAFGLVSAFALLAGLSAFVTIGYDVTHLLRRPRGIELDDETAVRLPDDGFDP